MNQYTSVDYQITVVARATHPLPVREGATLSECLAELAVTHLSFLNPETDYTGGSIEMLEPGTDGHRTLLHALARNREWPTEHLDESEEVLAVYTLRTGFRMCIHTCQGDCGILYFYATYRDTCM